MIKELQRAKNFIGNYLLKAERCPITRDTLWFESEIASIPVSNSGVKVKVLKRALSDIPIYEIATRVHMEARKKTNNPYSIEYLEDHLKQYLDENHVYVRNEIRLNSLKITE